MISQQGRITSVDQQEVTVEIGGVSGCPACDSGKGCGAGIFGRLLRNRQAAIQLPNTIDAVPGQAVKLGISEQYFLRLVFRMYALPLLAGLIGASVGFSLASSGNHQGLALDVWTLVAGIVAAGLVMIWTRKTLREFPGQTAVHLLMNDDTDKAIQCVTLSETRQDTR
ncbi:MAG TPA: SoxR reducing system RseC family protein [Xanthomonadales bacterium]|nr:SoxR reducing system RseC family protein [Xanthomonadales bacterium]